MYGTRKTREKVKGIKKKKNRWAQRSKLRESLRSFRYGGTTMKRFTNGDRFSFSLFTVDKTTRVKKSKRNKKNKRIEAAKLNSCLASLRNFLNPLHFGDSFREYFKHFSISRPSFRHYFGSIVIALSQLLRLAVRRAWLYLGNPYFRGVSKGRWRYLAQAGLL